MKEWRGSSAKGNVHYSPPAMVWCRMPKITGTHGVPPLFGQRLAHIVSFVVVRAMVVVRAIAGVNAVDTVVSFVSVIVVVIVIVDVMVAS